MGNSKEYQIAQVGAILAGVLKMRRVGPPPVRYFGSIYRPG